MRLFLLASLGFAAAKNGLDGWLRYAPLPCSHQCHSKLPSNIVTLNQTTRSPVYVAGSELQKGLKEIYASHVQIHHGQHGQCKDFSAVIVGTVAQYRKTCGPADEVPHLDEDGFWLNTKGSHVRILGQNEKGTLYGTYEYLSMLAQGNFSDVAYSTNPSALIRWVNQWDNMDGSIERGYGGPSIFFRGEKIVDDLARVIQYARLLASVRINAVVVNNVNANATLLAPENIQCLGRIADVFRPYGVQIGISLNFASPKTFGGLNIFDPLDTTVIKWWSNITNQIYQRVPDMAGYLIKADSEGQPGPQTYNRTLADAANLFAKAVKPYGGIVMYRSFVYDHNLNQSNWKADRANAAVDFFKHLDGKFNDNVVVQIKYGPIDFQVREPASPLFANLLNTSMAIELQVTQEYLGQQSHLVYLAPLWRDILDFDMRVDHKPSSVRDIVTAKRFNRKLGGSAAVVNVGTNTTWLGSHLAMSNLYAYGRLAWNPTDDPEDMLRDWIRLTFDLDRNLLDTITRMSMDSRPAYENYSGNLGIQTLTDILYTHYGPNPASQDNNGWGQWTRADRTTIGMDRTVKNGTDFSGQYPPEVAAMYESNETTPENLLLWFHHVDYTHRLHSGKTVIQHFYDAHYQGAETAQGFLDQWESLQGKIDHERYEHIRQRLEYQAGHSIVWRDTINNFYHNLSGIADKAKRVGNHPWRIDTGWPFRDCFWLCGYCHRSNDTAGTATTKLHFPSGMYDLAVNYYDLYGGQSRWAVYLNDRQIGRWLGNTEDILSHTPSIYLDGHSTTRIKFRRIKGTKGDTLRIDGTPDGVEPAPLDYVALLPHGVVD
ncbi:Glycoside hydrolase superfamily [Penicillium alfredii]|uniref:Alpha-glucuronidase n=1 Tax=Penicillium alfredii TaxID=1506179 RepID=A0A9W9FQE1_9EURO|nr:Glycoside hydrolase superfamily [Penicillium alfredii]KAJ5104456.1 Glycoside hydrolase superfamily [Penicillium alfredii]